MSPRENYLLEVGREMMMEEVTAAKEMVRGEMSEDESEETRER